ncbi:MAG: hypothetical protein MJE68_15460, partial [Proteobacteria bacterium]|nr:hypothetical protein [Pseudomonadota bacterium]
MTTYLDFKVESFVGVESDVTFYYVTSNYTGVVLGGCGLTSGVNPTRTHVHKLTRLSKVIDIIDYVVYNI